MQNPQKDISEMLSDAKLIDFLLREEYGSWKETTPEERFYDSFHQEKPVFSHFEFLTPLEVLPQKINIGWLATTTGMQLLYKSLTQSIPERINTDINPLRKLIPNLDLSCKQTIEIQEEIIDEMVPLQFRLGAIPRSGFNRYSGSGLIEIHGWDCLGGTLKETLKIPAESRAIMPWTQNYFGKPPKDEKMRVVILEPLRANNIPELVSLETLKEQVRIRFDTKTKIETNSSWSLDILGETDSSWVYHGMTPESISFDLNRESVLVYDTVFNGEQLRNYSKEKLVKFNKKVQAKLPTKISSKLFYCWETRLDLDNELLPAKQARLEIENLLEDPTIQVTGTLLDLDGNYSEKLEDAKVPIENLSITSQKFNDGKFPYRSSFKFGKGTLKAEEAKENELNQKEIPFSIEFEDKDFSIEADYHRQDWARASV